MKRLPKVQQEIYDYVKSYKETHDGNSPTRADIARHFGVSTQNIDAHILRLYKKKLVAFDEHGRIMVVGGEYRAPQPHKD
jgi:hypothetical protein